MIGHPGVIVKRHEAVAVGGRCPIVDDDGAAESARLAMPLS
jgi:hypothetical protein